MENQLYRIGINKDDSVEFYICQTNDTASKARLKEIGIIILTQGTQIDISLDESGTQSLIKYLADSLEYIKEYNQISKNCSPCNSTN